MKTTLRKLFEFFNILKVASMTLAALYLLFWFYRFFNFPLTDILYPIFDFFITPIKAMFETVQIYNGAVIEMGYFIMGVFLIFVSFVFGKIENFVLELERRNELMELALKQKMQNKINAEMEKEYTNEILNYKYFSAFVIYKISYFNELAAMQDKISLSNIIDRSYKNTTSLIRQYEPKVVSDKYGASVFIREADFENCDDIITSIIEAIKVVKKQNANDNIKTDFMIVLDAQADKKASYKSYETLVKVSGMDYFNKAIVTASFKARFDLIKDKSIYMTDTLGYAAVDKVGDGSELYLLKTKPDKI